jgi:hypothetical protein
METQGTKPIAIKYQARVRRSIADHVSGKDGGQPPFHTFSPLMRRLATVDGRIHAAQKIVECLFTRPTFTDQGRVDRALTKEGH